VAGIYAVPAAAPAAAETVDASGSLIYPGMVDAHVHCHSNQAETIELATQAAAAAASPPFWTCPTTSARP